MGSAVFHAGRRFGVEFFLCICCLAGASADADSSDGDRFVLTVSDVQPSVDKSSIDSKVRFDASVSFSAADPGLKDGLQLDDAKLPAWYDARPPVPQSILFAGTDSGVVHSAQTALHGSGKFVDTVFPVNIDVMSNVAADVDQADSLLAVTGLSLGWNLTPKLRLMLNGDYLSGDYEDINGSIINLRAGLKYRVFRYVGIGIGYDLLEVDIESTNLGLSGLTNYRQWGPRAFLSLRF